MRLFFQTWIVLKVEQGREDGWVFWKDRFVGGKKEVSNVLPGASSMYKFFHKLCEIFFFSCIFSSSCASRPCLVIFLYSTSSASSPWSPSISKAAYLLAELNFWKVKTKQTLDQYSSFGCYKNIAYTRQKMSTFSWSMKRKIRDNYCMTDVGLVLIGLMLILYLFILYFKNCILYRRTSGEITSGFRETLSWRVILVTSESD